MNDASLQEGSAMLRVLGVIAVLVVAGALALVIRLVPDGMAPAQVLQKLEHRTPGEWLRHARQRLEGHPTLESLALPLITWVQQEVERPVPEAPLPTLGKGQQASRLAPVRRDATGRPLPLLGAPATPAVAPREPAVVVHSIEGLSQAIARATPGQVIELAPGRYPLRATITTARHATAQAPIVVRGTAPGRAVIESTTTEAFNVRHAHWVFEDLTLRGTCGRDDDCEHAFHVVGPASGTVLRNLRLQDFNAPVKVNGEGASWPDSGLMEFSSLVNTRARDTGQPVSLFDLVGASGWNVSDNLVTHFVKRHGNQISYGLFMKGAGDGGRFERNLVVCTREGISQPGARVGISFGGGGSGARYCRDGRCEAEHSGGVARANVIAHCNDSGIDVRSSRRIVLDHNTLINTAGIDARGEHTVVSVDGNLLEGGMRARAGAVIAQRGNVDETTTRWLHAPDALDLRWRLAPALTPATADARDLCGTARGAATVAGAATVSCADHLHSANGAQSARF